MSRCIFQRKVVGDENDAHATPNVEHHKENPMPAGGPILVVVHTILFLDGPHAKKGQGGGDEVLHTHPGVRPRHAHQDVNILRSKRNPYRGDHHYEGEEDLVHKERVGHVPPPQEHHQCADHGLEVLSQGDADDGVAGGQGEDGEQSQVVAAELQELGGGVQVPGDEVVQGVEGP